MTAGPQPPATARTAFVAAPAPNLLLQRKCDCGGAGGVSGECAECESERRFGTTGVQPKLRVSAPDDHHEREADRLADEAIGMTPSAPLLRPAWSTLPASQPSAIRRKVTPLIQRQETTAAEVEEEEEPEEEIQPKRRGTTATPRHNTDPGGLRLGGAFDTRLRSARAGGQPLDRETRGDMEGRLGADLGHIRIHADASAARLSAQVRAEAFTLGSDVFFDTGAYAPRTVAGRRLLAHELVHTLQQAPSQPRTAAQRADGDSPTAAEFDGVEVTAPDDPSEHAADRAAAAVAATVPLSVSHARPAPADAAGDGTAAEPGAGTLARGGAPLPAVLRDLFEHRFDRDFGDVRVHTGSASQRLNEQLAARAFTYGSHVWLGAGEPVAATETMAHELAHVIQQTGPPTVAGRHPGRPASPPAVMRKLYWEPQSWDGQKTHERVLPEIRKANQGSHVFIEAPIPNATRRAHGVGVNHGRADLMMVGGQRRALGVQFTGPAGAEAPEPLPAPYRDYNKGYDHGRRSAPISDAPNSIRRIAAGPTALHIADLKPAPASPSGTRGHQQIRNYISGLQYARDQTNIWAAAQPRPPAAWPSLNAVPWGAVRIPKRLRGRDLQNQELVVKEFTWYQDPHDKQRWRPSRAVYKPTKPIKGHLVLQKPTPNNEIVQYRWKPSYPYSRETVTARLPALAGRLEKLIAELRQLKTKRKVAPSRLPGTRGRPAPTRVPPRVQRQPARRRTDVQVEDRFRAANWERERLRLRRDYGRARGLDDARLRYYLAQVDDDAGGRDNFARNLRALRDIGRLEFWTGDRARFLGVLRERFGSIFVRVLNLVHSFRSRLLGLLDRRSGRPPAPTSYGRVAVRAMLRAISQLAEPIFRQSMRVVSESFRVGVTNRLQRVFPLDDPHALFSELLKEEGDQFPALAELRTAVESSQARIDDLAGDLDHRFGALFAFIQELRSKAETFGTIIKVAMVAIQCGSPPIVGCLKLIASTAIAALADRVLQWCSIQRDFQGIALRSDGLRTLPQKLAKHFVDALPDQQIIKVGNERISVQDFFDRAPLDSAPPARPVDPEGCEPRSLRAPTAQHAALAELMTDLGCDEDPESEECQRVGALGELMEKAELQVGAMSPDEIRRLRELILGNNFTAEDLKAAAAVVDSQGIKMSLIEFLEWLPQWAESVEVEQRMGGEQAGAGLSVGEIFYELGDAAALMKDKTRRGVGAVYRFSEQGLAFGTVDWLDIGDFDCSDRARIKFRASYSNVRLLASGRRVTTNLEGRRGTIRIVNPRDSTIEALCGP